MKIDCANNFKGFTTGNRIILKNIVISIGYLMDDSPIYKNCWDILIDCALLLDTYTGSLSKLKQRVLDIEKGSFDLDNAHNVEEDLRLLHAFLLSKQPHE